MALFNDLKIWLNEGEKCSGQSTFKHISWLLFIWPSLSHTQDSDSPDQWPDWQNGGFKWSKGPLQKVTLIYWVSIHLPIV